MTKVSDTPAKRVYQPNHITMAKQEFEVIEKRIVYLTISRLQTGRNVQEELFKNITVRIPYKELGESNTQRIKAAAASLSEKKIGLKKHNIIQLDIGTKPKKSKGEDFDFITPFPRIRNIGREGLEITVFSDVLPYFMELKGGYTEYSLQYALLLKSRYSQCFYEFINRFKDTGVWGPVPVEELKEILSVDTKYKQYGMFKTRVLEVAREEINQITDLEFEYEEILNGRKVEALKFMITKKSETQKPAAQLFESPADPRTEAVGRQCKELGINDVYKAQILANEELVKAFNKAVYDMKLRKNKPHNPAAYVLAVIGILARKEKT